MLEILESKCYTIIVKNKYLSDGTTIDANELEAVKEEKKELPGSNIGIYTVHQIQCGKITNFLPLRFYVKLNFGGLKPSKMLCLAILEVLKFDFNEILQVLRAEIY